jgi:hypothetical protein
MDHKGGLRCPAGAPKPGSALDALPSSSPPTLFTVAGNKPKMSLWEKNKQPGITAADNPFVLECILGNLEMN